jgi:hypothetical protein
VNFVLVIPFTSLVQTQDSGDDLRNLIYAEGVPEVVANGPLRRHVAHEGENDMQVLQRSLVPSCFLSFLKEMVESYSTDKPQEHKLLREYILALSTLYLVECF